ncbi:MAG: hypothetical protein IRZ08_06115 [Frankia sp.]|nr:hypothetical protein [Frankia sp.]
MAHARDELRYYRYEVGRRFDRLVVWAGGRSRFRRRVLPAVAGGVAVVLGLTLWAVIPGSAGGSADAVANDRPATPTTDPAATAPAAESPSPSPTAQPTESPAAVPAIPRVARAATSQDFPSGMSAGSLSQVQAWAQWRGRPVDVVVTYTARKTWREIVNPWIGSDTKTFRNFPGTWVITAPLFPPASEGSSEPGNLQDCAAGAYNSRWEEFGRWLVRMGRPDTFVRLGWEFNGDWYDWRASNPQAWIACFRNAALAIKRTDPAVRIDWNFNAHDTQVPGVPNAFALYPGDDVVDVIGVDSYDHFPPSPDAAAFDRQCNGEDGLCRAISFARQHNKLFSVPEWGVVGDHGGGGDNPIYIQKMHDLFVRNADILAYEAYFNDAVPGNIESSLFDPVQHPRSAELYVRLW